MIIRVPRLFKRAVGLRVPLVGDLVWWAPKQFMGRVTEVRGNMVTFQGGELVENKKGRIVPRWTTMSRSENYKWDRQFWVIGQGPTPKISENGQIIYPDPVSLSGKSRGSFAVKS